MALYVYGLMRAREALRAATASTSGPQLSCVRHGGLGALVSHMREGEARLRRESVTAHSDVLAGAFAHGPVLPLRFGSVLSDEQAAIDQLMAPAHDQLLARLDALDGKGEMQIRAVYLEEPLLRSILARDPGLARLVGQVQGQPAAATHFERIRIGEAIAGAVQARRAHDEAAFVGALAPLALAVSVSEPHHERSALNAAFLVETAQLEAFDAAAERLSTAHADIQFKLLGPMPAYSFADRDWDRADSREVRGAWA